MKIEAKDFAAAIADILAEYGEEVKQNSEDALKKTAQKINKELKKAGDYGTVSKKPFRNQFAYELINTRLSTTAVIGNKKAGLTHLLEFGHATRSGGRSEAFHFMEPLNDTTEEVYLEELNKLL